MQSEYFILAAVYFLAGFSYIRSYPAVFRYSCFKFFCEKIRFFVQFPFSDSYLFSVALFSFDFLVELGYLIVESYSILLYVIQPLLCDPLLSGKPVDLFNTGKELVSGFV